MPSTETPPARPMFRKVAMAISILCFILVAVFGVLRPEDGLFPPVIFLFAGFVMATIGATGYWPRRK